ncbi:endolytic transglycosylase MltG [Litorilituus sediminis]|uniref:Endolytic murein transglycosylase n=1 Tax=Litorilituus sediminis TaxID=718192 RepID=A0A4P6P1U8_9GAMM|nr:endolytic transglycosylase MltG [Litorilituus sediminis]QBG34538.1 endolytic transglycosylase MltG [Litorilituus sediminis]
MLKKIAFLFLLCALMVSAGIYVFITELKKPLLIQQAELLTVNKGSSISRFSAELVKKGWLTERFWLRNYGRIFPEKVKIKAGTYLVQPGSNSFQLLQQLVRGEEHQFSITFIEGSTFKEWLAQLEKQPHIKHTLKDKSIAEVAKLLEINQTNPEGWFFPETYAYTAGTDDLTLLRRAYSKMRNVLESAWSNRQANLPYKSAYEALIMASIIEKETSYLQEQDLIASVFVNRLNKKMRLQTDPTIIYGLGDRYQGDITYAHKREKTAYNTYRIDGLPPTPIAMPGLSAIIASVNPASSDYFYFVSNGQGKHVFSKNLSEHNAAVKRYLEYMRNKQE